jgi:hypothetical protein
VSLGKLALPVSVEARERFAAVRCAVVMKMKPPPEVRSYLKFLLGLLNARYGLMGMPCAFASRGNIFAVVLRRTTRNAQAQSGKSSTIAQWGPFKSRPYTAHFTLKGPQFSGF